MTMADLKNYFILGDLSYDGYVTMSMCGPAKKMIDTKNAEMWK
jgi:hypothetical protein